MKKPLLCGLAIAVAALGALLYFRRPPELPAPPTRPPVPEVQRLGERQWKVPKKLREEYFADPARVNREIVLQPTPGAAADDVAELRIALLQDSSPLYAAGFRKDDRILEVNGAPVKTMGRALNLMNEIRTSDRVTVKIDRAGSLQEYRIDFD